MKLDLPLINTHTHAAMIGLRGLGEDESLHSWLNNYIWPAEKKIDKKFVFDQSKKAIGEMQKNKIAAFCDMYFYEDEVARAAIKMQMPVVLGIVMTDSSETAFDRKLAETEKLILKYKDNPYVSVSVAPHAIYTVKKENLIKAKALARKYGVLFQMHLAETKKEFDDCVNKNGSTPTQYVDDLGLLDRHTLLAHCVWVTDEDIAIIAKSGASVAHCPLSNLKLGSGIAPIAKMLRAGINVSIGTDGPASSNRLDIWEAGKIAALLQKGINHDPSIINSLDIVKMMTVNGMRALHIDKIEGRTVSQIDKQIDKISDLNFLYHLNIEDLK
jgi:5-methylthioadenosine/S-adenosylhomocysteine deaminase